MSATVTTLQQANAQQQQQIGLLNEEIRRLWRGLRCTNQKVADFMVETEQCARGQCPQRDLERVLAFMVDQRHVLIRLKPFQGARDMAPFRISQLQDLLKPSEVNAMSRLLILAMPVGLSREDAVKLPEARGDQILYFVRRELQLAQSVGAVGPFLVNCEQKAQLLDNYSRHVASDKPCRKSPSRANPR